jgi:TonB-linked SusC/RagA family outer membrane protein
MRSCKQPAQFFLTRTPLHPMRMLIRVRPIATVACMVLTSSPALAQSAPTSSTALQLAVDDRGPRFLSPPTDGRRADVSDAPMLRRRVDLELTRVPLAAALHEITRQTGIEFALTSHTVPVEQLVSVSATNITVASALHEILLDTGVDVELSSPRVLTLIARPSGPIAHAAQGTGTITGHVTDGALKAPLSEVSIRVEGTALRTTANTAGKYTIPGVAPGTYRLTARRVGYQPLTKEITVAGEQTATLDFALVAAPTRLDEVVTTAVGEQRRYEVGNDISTINADSIAPTAPITSLTDLISARAPGVTVLETSGMTGSGEAIRIEGLTSLVLQNDPILIVDGVRQDNSAGGDIASYLYNQTTHPTPTRLNDIDFSDIATIDILKGPSASTEYGTDAANGVIVITTKHGSAGAPQWKASAEQTESDIPVRFPDGYYSWGHLTNGTNSPVNCLLATGSYTSTSGACVVDSVTKENPLNNPATSIFGTGNRAKYDLSVSGGSEAVRYFVSGGLSNETGVIQMPSVFKELADTANLGLPSAALNPNSEQQRSVRVNTAIKLGPAADLTATGSYLSTYQQTPNAATLYDGVFYAPALSGPANNYGYGDRFGDEANTPLSQLTELGSQNTDRVTGGLTANWRPAGWFVGHATVGLDHGSQLNEVLTYPLANAAYEYYVPSLGLVDVTTDVYSVDLRGTATASLTHGLRAVSSAGLQMVDTRLAGQSALTDNITATNLTLNGATGPMVTQLGTRQATLGGYGEEELSLADRLFVTGALRIDAASGFGYAYSTAAYPKASVSWLALNNGQTTVRVRGAFGESGVQPMNGAALQLYSPTVATIGSGGSPVSVSTLNWPGNPNLQPERSAEFEGGVDVGAWGNRLSLELTGYSKMTHDALVNVNLGEDFNYLPYQENIGEVRNTGLEGSVTVAMVQTRSVTWDVAVNASLNHNVLVSLAPGVTAQVVYGYSNNTAIQYRQAVGYPLYGLWAQPVTYADANHDGIIEPNEVTVGDSADYVGPSLPTQDVSISTHLGLWRGAVTIGSLVDYRGGYKIANLVANIADYEGNTPGANDPAAPLWLQARAIANVTSFNATALDVEDGSFVRVREVSVTYAVPRGAVRALRMQSLSVTGAVRNLALWTRYSGLDPETSNTYGSNIEATPTTNGSVVNNDQRADVGAVPLARYWVVRLNIGL